jgi:hypothetical protein
MKLFSKIVESSQSTKHYKVQAEIELMISATNQGEASYLGDSILASTKNQSEYTIKSVEEVSEMELKESVDIDMGSISQDLPPEDKIHTAWTNTFGDRVPTNDEKMEFYHQLRKLGFDGVVIFNTLKEKI